VTTITAKKFIVAVGGRPTPLDCFGGELAISSDDIFMKETAPGRTCVIGAGYVALECAGFLSGLHQGEVVVLVRSVPLRGFDRDVVDRVLKYMRAGGTTILTEVSPLSIEKLESGKLRVEFSSGITEDFDTVLAAIGRQADTLQLGLENIGVTVNPKNGKIICLDEQTSIPNIYAVGDVVDGAPELTPVAIHAGKLLARRLFSDVTQKMNYQVCKGNYFNAIYSYSYLIFIYYLHSIFVVYIGHSDYSIHTSGIGYNHCIFI
jgi:pyruvate/2-oxoglutarate dehydrogenase complex dihydrolipoamide dehydrogenase (E3) component